MQDNKRPEGKGRTVRDALHSRAFKNGAYASVLCAVMLALVVALNLFVGALPAKYLRYDMTENKLYSLSQETEDLCAALTQDVTFYYLGRTGQEDAAVTELLDKYKDASSHIQVVQKDPVLYPTFGAAYDAADAAVGSIIAVCGERYRVVDAGDLYTYTPNYQTYTYDTEFDGEGALTSALSYVASEEAPLLYTLSGHGEAGLSATLTDGAERQNMSFETLALLTADAVPEDAAAVVLNAPTKDISAEEAERLRTYLAGGGSLFLVTNYGDYSTEAMPNLTALLAEYGMGARDGIVIENDQNRFLSGYPYYLLPNIKSHDVTQPLVDSGSYVLAPLATPSRCWTKCRRMSRWTRCWPLPPAPIPKQMPTTPNPLLRRTGTRRERSTWRLRRRTVRRAARWCGSPPAVFWTRPWTRWSPAPTATWC